MSTRTSVVRSAPIFLALALIGAACSEDAGDGGGASNPGGASGSGGSKATAGGTSGGSGGSVAGSAGTGAAGSSGSSANAGSGGSSGSSPSAGSGGSSGSNASGSGGEAGASNTAPSVSGIVTAFRPNLLNLQERVPGALVTLKTGSQQFSATSDGDGLFVFDSLPAGSYHASITVDATARAFHDGAPYGDWYGEVQVVANQTTSLMPTLNLGCTIPATVSASTDAVFSTSGAGNQGCGTYGLFGRLRVPAGGLVHANGATFSAERGLQLRNLGSCDW